MQIALLLLLFFFPKVIITVNSVNQKNQAVCCCLLISSIRSQLYTSVVLGIISYDICLFLNLKIIEKILKLRLWVKVTIIECDLCREM